MTAPTVSVLIDTYNHERYIEQTVVSVLEQNFPREEIEVVVVDDGSTDRTPAIVQKFAPRVRLLRKKNGGQASAFNAGFTELRGEIVSFLDGDDWFAPGKISAVVAALEREPEASGVGHGYYRFHEANRQTTVCAPSETKFLNLETPEAARQACKGWASALASAFTVRRGTLEKIMPIPSELAFNADSPIALGAMACGVRLLKEPLSYYRIHAENLYEVDPNNTERLRRRNEMLERMFQILERQLIRQGVPVDSIAALLYPDWTEASRAILRNDGGGRLKTFRTEMRAFRYYYRNPTVAYRLFKYLVVGSAAFLLPPRRFYRAWEWYGRRDITRYREWLFRAERC